MKWFNDSIVMLLLLMFCSCNNNTKESTAIIKETVKTVKETPKVDDFRERLKATEPATEMQLQNCLPTNLNGFKRIEFTKSRISQSDIASAGAIYKNSDATKKIEITIVDGASQDGLLAINPHYMAQTMKFSSKKSSGYQKTYENNSLKVLETYVENDSYYDVKFLVDMRFGITVVSLGINHDALWDIISTLDLNKLNTL